jgi:hypothetical protein
MTATDGVTARLWAEAMAAAQAAEMSVDFVWERQNYKALVGALRGTLDSGCPGCGVAYRTATDVSLVHRAPPRHPHDWERLHAINVRLLCGACAQAIATHGYAAWLDSFPIELPSARPSATRRRQRAPAGRGRRDRSP